MGSNSLGLDLPLQFFPAMVVSQMQKEDEEEEEQDLLQPSSSSMDMTSSSTESRSKADLDQPVKCPRCHSFNTKFCYYNNYSFTQPRHYCKSCKRYWTKGGNLRNVPVGGGCRKNKMPNSSAFQRRNSATSAFMAVAGNEEGEGEGEKGRERMALHEEQEPKRCKTEEESFIPEFSNLPLLLQLHHLPQLDSSFPAFASLPSQVPKRTDQNFFEDDNEGLLQTQTQSTSDVGRVSLTDSIALSDIEPNLVNCANSGFDTRTQNVEYRDEHQQDSQQGGQQEKNLNIMPADQILVDEKAWRHLVADASAETIDQMKDNFFITGSQKLPYDFKDVAFDWQMGSEGFDPTNDLSYMGGPEFWSGFPIFDAGSGTVI